MLANDSRRCKKIIYSGGVGIVIVVDAAGIGIGGGGGGVGSDGMKFIGMVYPNSVFSSNKSR